MDIRSIVRKAGEDILLVFHEKTRVVTAGKGSRKRMFVKCLLCEQYEEEARRCSGNSRVFIAQGVHCDSKKKLQDVVDYLGPSHSAKVERKRIEALWGSRDERHP